MKTRFCTFLVSVWVADSVRRGRPSLGRCTDRASVGGRGRRRGPRPVHAPDTCPEGILQIVTVLRSRSEKGPTPPRAKVTPEVSCQVIKQGFVLLNSGSTSYHTLSSVLVYVGSLLFFLYCCPVCRDAVFGLSRLLDRLSNRFLSGVPIRFSFVF